MTPTYQSGFAAPQRGRMKWPELWRGCVGAWNPGLGQSGLVLRDHSTYGNHGTLTNGPTWGVSGGRQALSFDGSNDYVNCGDPQATRINGDVSVSAWVYPESTNALAIIGHATGSQCYWCLVFSFNGSQRLSFWNSAAGLAVLAPDGTALNKWVHVGARRTSAGTQLFIGGKLVATAAGSTSTATGGDLSIGRFGAYPGYYGQSKLDDIRVYSKGLSDANFATLATRTGIAYELAPRRRSSIQVPATSGFSVLKPTIIRASA